MIPLELCAPTDEADTKYRDWARHAITSSEERENISEIRQKVKLAFSTFNMPFLSLPVNTAKDTALDVFIKMNTSATPLSIYDIVVAQVEAVMGKSLHDMVSDCIKLCPNILSYYDAGNLALYASALIAGKDPTNSTYLQNGFGGILLENWDKLVVGMQKTVAFLESERIFDAKRLPSDVVIPVLTAIWSNVEDGLDKEGKVRNILNRYMWSAFFTNRYESSTNSRSPADYKELFRLIHTDDETVPAILDRKLYPLPTEDEIKDAKWPAGKDRLGRAVMCLSLRQGALDFADGSTISRQNITTREYHHLFPDALLQKDEFGKLTEKEIYRALNCGLITWHTNRNISAKTPQDYLSTRARDAALGEEEVIHRLKSHYIPFQEIKNNDYTAFLVCRAKLVVSKLTELCDFGIIK